jgi:hypothetical protein
VATCFSFSMVGWLDRTVGGFDRTAGSISMAITWWILYRYAGTVRTDSPSPPEIHRSKHISSPSERCADEDYEAARAVRAFGTPGS